MVMPWRLRRTTISKACRLGSAKSSPFRHWAGNQASRGRMLLPVLAAMGGVAGVAEGAGPAFPAAKAVAAGTRGQFPAFAADLGLIPGSTQAIDFLVMRVAVHGSPDSFNPCYPRNRRGTAMVA